MPNEAQNTRPMRNRSETRPQRPAQAMTPEHIDNVLNELGVGDRIKIWLQPITAFHPEDGHLNYHDVTGGEQELDDDELALIIADKPFSGVVTEHDGSPGEQLFDIGCEDDDGIAFWFSPRHHAEIWSIELVERGQEEIYLDFPGANITLSRADGCLTINNMETSAEHLRALKVMVDIAVRRTRD